MSRQLRQNAPGRSGGSVDTVLAPSARSRPRRNAAVSLSNRGSDREIANRKGVVAPSGSDLARLVRSANRWRDEYNPLRYLTIRRAVDLVDCWDRGEFADLMWTYRAVERANETLSALMSRRSSALLKLDWEIKTVADDDLPRGATRDQAEAQKDALREAYDRLKNLKAAIAHLALAEFRGFAHCYQLDADGDGLVDTLEPIDQWNVVREGIRGAWFYNQDGQRRSARSLDKSLQLDPADLVSIECERHVDWIALFCHIRMTLAQKDWVAFVERFGLNSTIIILPPGIPPGREIEYSDAAQGVAKGGTGSLPSGSEVKFANSEKGTLPFLEFIEEQKSAIVLAGTGGKLTMLNEATGLGSGQSQSHQDTFDDIARAHAGKISEALQAQFDLRILQAQFPGQPVLAYFELCANEETNTSEFVKDVQGLSTAGYQVAVAQIAEKTGYEVELKAPPAATAKLPAAQLLTNSARRAATAGDKATLKVIDQARQLLRRATAEELRPLTQRLSELAAIQNDTEWQQAAAKLGAELQDPASSLRSELGKSQGSAGVLAEAIGAGLVNGLSEK